MLILFVSVLILVFAFILRVYKLLILDGNNHDENFVKSNSSTAQGYFIYKEFYVYKLVKKINAKLPFSISCILLILLFNVSANVSIWPNVKGMSIEDKNNSIVFKNMRGSNCINEFATLKNVMTVAVNNGYSNADMIRILGKPNNVLKNGSYYQYDLFPSTNGCVAIIEFSNNKMVGFQTKNCN